MCKLYWIHYRIYFDLIQIKPKHKVVMYKTFMSLVCNHNMCQFFTQLLLVIKTLCKLLCNEQSIMSFTWFEHDGKCHIFTNSAKVY